MSIADRECTLDYVADLMELIGRLHSAARDRGYNIDRLLGSLCLEVAYQTWQAREKQKR